jgi:hypothetical protein
VTVQAGICEFCKITDDEIDGCRISWLDSSRTCCNKFACRKQHEQKIAAEKTARMRAARRRTPGEIHQLIKEEAKAKRARYRAAAKARGLLKPAEERKA